MNTQRLRNLFSGGILILFIFKMGTGVEYGHLREDKQTTQE